MIKQENKLSTFKTVRTFQKVGTCSETLFKTLNDVYGNTMEKEEKAAMFFAGGITQYGYQCGLIWGSAFAAGARAYQQLGYNSKAEMSAISATQNLVNAYRKENKYINCEEITELNKQSSSFKLITFFLLKAGVIKCWNLAAKFALKMNLSEKHQIMLSALAGGIGLCGGACGLLGAAIWLKAIKEIESGKIKNDYKNPEIEKLIEKFLEASDYKFECKDITNMTFANPEEHFKYIKSGSCNKIIEAMVKEFN